MKNNENVTINDLLNLLKKADEVVKSTDISKYIHQPITNNSLASIKRDMSHSLNECNKELSQIGIRVCPEVYTFPFIDTVVYELIIKSCGNKKGEIK